jgi:hypothetical protein
MLRTTALDCIINVVLTVPFVHVFQISQFHFVIDYIEVDAGITRLLKAGKLAAASILKERRTGCM